MLQLFVILLKLKGKKGGFLCVPLGGAGVEGGACPTHGRVVLTY